MDIVSILKRAWNVVRAKRALFLVGLMVAFTTAGALGFWTGLYGWVAGCRR